MRWNFSKRWNSKQLLGLGGVVLGVIAVFMSRHYMAELDHARKGAKAFARMFKSSAVEKGFFGKLSEYDAKVQLLMYVGILLIAAGLAALYYFRRK